MVSQFILIINRRFDAQLSSITIVRQNTYLYYSFIGLKCALFLILDINRTYQMFAHHSFALLYPLMTMYSYSEQVEDAVDLKLK